jgi:hypothetical protein
MASVMERKCATANAAAPVNDRPVSFSIYHLSQLFESSSHFLTQLSHQTKNTQASVKPNFWSPDIIGPSGSSQRFTAAYATFPAVSVAIESLINSRSPIDSFTSANNMPVEIPEYMGKYNDTGKIYPIAILFSTLAWGSWLLCVAPLIWHVSQRNVAAGSLVLWTILCNISLGINPLIWGHDNIAQWWDGVIWCDINVRIQIGAQVALGASVAMILRRLAKVMDTRNITVSLSRNSKLRGQLIEAGWCWGYPLVIILLYIPVQSARYNIWGIEGCISAYRPNMRSLFLTVIWMPVTMMVVFYYAGRLLTCIFAHFVLTRSSLASRSPLPLPPRVLPSCHGPQHYSFTFPPLVPNVHGIPHCRRTLLDVSILVLLQRNGLEGWRLRVQSGHDLHVSLRRRDPHRQVGTNRHGLCHLPPLRHRHRRSQHLQEDVTCYWPGQYLPKSVHYAR